MNLNNMEEVQLRLSPNGRGAFVLDHAGDLLARMDIGISGGNLTAYHTEVSDKLKGQGVGSKLLSAMVAYARQNKLQVIALCPFVQAQFKRNPEKYADIWNQHWHTKKRN